MRTPGHSVLVVPVPELNNFVLTRTRHYDPSFVPADSSFVNAHVTLLGPWLAEPTPADLSIVEGIASRTTASSATLAQIDEFPDGTIHLVPQPADLFSSLTDQLVSAFPHCPPYGGVFPEVVPHLTVDHRAGGVTIDDVRLMLGSALPVDITVDRIDLQWWANDDCRLLRSWPLSAPDSATSR